jgi:hypothetical protein
MVSFLLVFRPKPCTHSSSPLRMLHAMQSKKPASNRQPAELALLTRPWRWRRYIPPKRRLNFISLHGVISEKTVIYVTTAVRTPNPTRKIHHYGDVDVTQRLRTRNSRFVHSECSDYCLSGWKFQSLSSLFYSEDGRGSRFSQNTGISPSNYMTSHPKRP